MPWSFVRFTEHDTAVVAEGPYSSHVTRCLEALGFAYDPDHQAHRLQVTSAQQRYQRMLAAQMLLAAHGIDVAGRRAPRADEVTAAISRVETRGDLAVLADHFFNSPDSPAQSVHTFLTTMTGRLADLPPDRPTTVMDVADLERRLTELAAGIHDLAGTLHSVTRMTRPRRCAPPAPAPPAPPSPGDDHRPRR